MRPEQLANRGTLDFPLGLPSALDFRRLASGVARVCSVAQTIVPFGMNPTLKHGYSSRTIMTNRKGYSSERRLACSRCGTTFACNPEGDCWCKEETIRLPIPAAGEDCLCRECLRKMTEQTTGGETSSTVIARSEATKQSNFLSWLYGLPRSRSQ